MTQQVATSSEPAADERDRSDRAAQSGRYPSIDILKASAILAVIWIHVFLNWGAPQVGALRWLGSLSRFAVPGFFFASGFLYFQYSAVSARALAKRTTRIVVPYLVASLIAIAGYSVEFGTRTPYEIGFDLLLGNAVGPFYFVPPLICAVILTAVLSRVPLRVVFALFVLLWWLRLLMDLGFITMKGPPPRSPLFWDMRNPLRWWGYFTAGWLMGSCRTSIWALGCTARRRIGLAALMSVVGLFIYAALMLPEGRTRSWLTLEYLRIYGCLIAIFFLTFDWRRSGLIRWISEATYPIYLYHFFFISLYRFFLTSAMQRYFSLSPFSLNLGAYVIGLGGSLAVIWLGRRLCGRHARLVIG